MDRLQGRLLHLVVLAAVVIVVVTAATVTLGDRDPSVDDFYPDEDRPVGAIEPLDLELADGLRLLRGGDAPAAASVLEALREDPDTSIAAGARLNLAKAYLEQGLTDEALLEVDELRTAYPDRIESDMALGLAARILDQTGQGDQAIDLYQALGGRYAALRPYIDLEVSAIAWRQGRFDMAIQRAESAASGNAILRTEVAALERIRAIQRESNDTRGFASTTERLIEIATLPVYQSQLMYELAGAHQSLGQREAAIEGYLQVLGLDVTFSYAALAVDALDRLDAGDAIESTDRGLAWFHAGRHSEAIEAFDEALRRDSEDDVARYHRAISVQRAGNISGAGGLLRVAERHPDSALAPRALLQAGRYLDDSDRPADSEAVYRQIIDQYPDTDEAADARFRLGLNAWGQGEDELALDMFRGTAGSSQKVARARLWAGKVHQRRDQLIEATAAWNEAMDADPRGFYGLRAARLIDGQNMPTMDEQVVVPDLDEALSAWRDQWFEKQGTSLLDSTSALLDDPAWLRIELLLGIGLNTEAGWEIQALAQESGAETPKLVALATELIARKLPEHAYQVGRAMVAPGDLADPGDWAAVGPALYPPAYVDTVSQLTEDLAVDPLLMIALIRQESAFDPSAHSWADARGLTQVMPGTGQAIANGIGSSDWVVEDLYRPDVAIEFGAIYLRERVDTHNGNLFAALAGYNAGDEPVNRWLSTHGADDPDFFLESIDYPETYEYVQIVYSNYLNYRSLYRMED